MSHLFRSRSGLSWGLSCVALVLLGAAVQASGPCLGYPFCTINKRCQERPPCWHNKPVCPKPICDPCTLEHHGYYHTCWRPSSIPPDWSHCPVPPPAVMFFAPPAGGVPPEVPQLPQPRSRELPQPGI